jgi:hypothetical protein
MYLIKKIEGCTFIYRILLQLIIPQTIINISVLLKDSNYIIKPTLFFKFFILK